MSIDKNNPTVIAEIGQAHDGSLGILHSLIEAISKTGVNVIKFQMHIADSESSVHDKFRVPFSRVDATRQDYWRRMELTLDQWCEVKSHCETVGCEFLCTPFSVQAVQILDRIGVSQFKIGSGDITNHLLLDAISRSKKPVILSSGMSTFEELDRAIELFTRQNIKTTVLQCTSEYPVLPERWGLNLISELRSRYKIPVGLSDHSGTIFPGLAAISMGADVIEVHTTFDKRMFGPDSSSSLDINELATLVEGVKKISAALSSPVLKDATNNLNNMRQLFGRSLTASRDIPDGTPVSFDDLEAAKPAGHGMSPAHYSQILGKKLKHCLLKGDFIMESDFE